MFTLNVERLNTDEREYKISMYNTDSEQKFIPRSPNTSLTNS